MKRIVGGVVALLLCATACGGEDDEPDPNAALTGSEKTAAASIMEYWRKAGVDNKAAKCLGDTMVRSFGVAHLQDLKLLDARYQATDSAGTAFNSKADAPKAAELIVDCRGLPTLMKQLYENIDDDTATCLAAAYGRDRMVAAMTARLEGETGEKTPADVELEMSKCVPAP